MRTTTPLPAVYLSSEAETSLRNRLRRLNGQVAGIERMLEERRNCDEILVQVAALKQAVNSVAVALLKAHIDTCESECGDSAPRSLQALAAALSRVLKHA